MSNQVPNELEICFYVQGHEDAYPIFAIQFPNGYAPVPFKEIGCDEEGVFLATEDGQVTRISHDQGRACYDQAEGAPALLLHMLDDMGDFHSECEIVRLDRESGLAYGG